MSEKVIEYYFAAGVFKFDHFTVGFPDLQKTVTEWNERDPHFVSLIVRKVSEDNYGIQFVYYRKFEGASDIYDPMKDFKNELIEKFSRKAFYAWDFQTSTDSALDKIKTMVIKQEKLELE
jgi:hypothetical protein